MSYFARNYKNFVLKVGKPGFRAPQLGALHSLTGHFYGSKSPALVILPTGSGKTMIATSIPYLLQAKRVLVITPSRLLREQIAEKFSDLFDMQEIEALPFMVEKPKVKIVANRITTAAGWEELKEYDVVVSTVYSLASTAGDETIIPPELFDLVIVDEAHHAAAATWQKALTQFESAKKILLTATPFRLDKKEIKGKIVYVYDVKSAHEDKVFGDLTFVPVEPSAGQSADEAIAKSTESIFRRDKRNGLDHLIMVRVDSLKRGKELVELYQRTTELRLAFVRGSNALSTVKKVVQKLKDGELDGLICVNMFGEGFDLPKLKIAALHSPHRSLAVTLQFIGRFARTNDPSIGKATFVAYPEEQKQELRDLWVSDTIWPEIIHDLSAEKIFAEAANREILQSFKISSAEDTVELNLFNIRPYFHVKILQCEDGVDFSRDIQLMHNENLVHLAPSEDGNSLIRVTQTVKKPKWITESDIQDLTNNLDILYFDQEHNLLFICSSRKGGDHYSRIGNAVAIKRIRALSLSELNSALNEVEGMEFFHVGMRKRQIGGRSESYRTLSGPRADAAVDEIDGQNYDQGHSFGKGRSNGKDITIGISASSKVWSSTVAGIPELFEWCTELSSKIGSQSAKPTGTGLDKLSAGDVIAEFPDHMIAAIFDEKTYERNPTISWNLANQSGLCDNDIYILNQSGGELTFRISNGVNHWDGLCSLGSYPLITELDSSVAIPQVIGRNESIGLDEYLEDNPPRFFSASLMSVQGNSAFCPPISELEFDKADAIIVDWKAENVNIQLEKPEAGKGKSIFEWMESFLKDDHEFIFNDDGSGEVADYISLSHEGDHTIISLYHCKATSSSKPGARVNDFYDVIGQAVRSGVWLKRQILYDRLVHRNKLAGVAGVLTGNMSKLREAYSPQKRHYLKFKLFIVQPGASYGNLSDNVIQLLASAKTMSRANGFESFQLICSE